MCALHINGHCNDGRSLGEGMKCFWADAVMHACWIRCQSLVEACLATVARAGLCDVGQDSIKALMHNPDIALQICKACHCMFDQGPCAGAESMPKSI